MFFQFVYSAKGGIPLLRRTRQLSLCDFSVLLPYPSAHHVSLYWFCVPTLERTEDGDLPCFLSDVGLVHEWITHKQDILDLSVIYKRNERRTLIRADDENRHKDLVHATTWLQSERKAHIELRNEDGEVIYYIWCDILDNIPDFNG